jgi:hypothetical protein
MYNVIYMCMYVYNVCDYTYIYIMDRNFTIMKYLSSFFFTSMEIKYWPFFS